MRAINRKTKRSFCIASDVATRRIQLFDFSCSISSDHLSRLVVLFSSRLIFTIRYHGARIGGVDPRESFMQAVIIVTVESAFSEGERGGSSLAGVMVHTAHSRRLEKRKPRAKRQRERRAVMHAIMRINELWRYLWLYQARSTAPLPTPPVPELIFLSRSSLHDRIHLR